jgi:alpha-tubulin suppressor-like RCC1 family protein
LDITYTTHRQPVHDNNTQTLHQYPSIRDLLSNTPPSHIFPYHPTPTQLVAYATGFAALSPPPTNQVHTWGDERYTACLGREPTPSNPADTPGPVPDLADLPTGPITKLAAGGYLLAALTAGNDLYCWGHAGRCAMLADLSDTPSPVVINDHDILDVAVGDAHMLVLTTDRQVYVIGDNANGQLGLPGVSATRTWTRIDLGSVLGAGEFVTGVAAGPRSSFLVAGKQPK